MVDEFVRLITKYKAFEISSSTPTSEAIQQRKWIWEKSGQKNVAEAYRQAHAIVFQSSRTVLPTVNQQVGSTQTGKAMRHSEVDKKGPAAKVYRVYIPEQKNTSIVRQEVTHAVQPPHDFSSPSPSSHETRPGGPGVGDLVEAVVKIGLGATFLLGWGAFKAIEATANWLQTPTSTSHATSVNRSGSKLHRASSCYSCGTSVNSSAHDLCSICGWIICPQCTACGCGWNKLGMPR